MRRAQIIAAEQFTYFIPICIAGVYYYIFIAILEYLGKKIEKNNFFFAKEMVATVTYSFTGDRIYQNIGSPRTQTTALRPSSPEGS